MMRESPCDEPLSWGGSNESYPTAPTPRQASRHSVNAPMAPNPTTATSTRSIHDLVRDCPVSHWGGARQSVGESGTIESLSRSQADVAGWSHNPETPRHGRPDLLSPGRGLPVGVSGAHQRS